ncbi:uncharacterized protein LOC128171831 [Crassostrea angulata]|uniref:uncharacterized protein LOC128171831 n=1 Tax=Magallana angulata TaxID=2784310 RepID=UPI0022B1E5C8|nr:uncharacterized protein LOC128171831 [Crassostrea angulata]XP_052693572.1 uncharacterized protein LOC128171831 [Crassostrea angulata]
MVILIGTGVCACCRQKLTMSFKQHEVSQKDEATETEDDLSCMKPTENEKCIHEETQGIIKRIKDCERHSQEQSYELSGSISSSQTVFDSQQSQSSVCNQVRLNMFNQILLSFNKIL